MLRIGWRFNRRTNSNRSQGNLLPWDSHDDATVPSSGILIGTVFGGFYHFRDVAVRTCPNICNATGVADIQAAVNDSSGGPSAKNKLKKYMKNVV